MIVEGSTSTSRHVTKDHDASRRVVKDSDNDGWYTLKESAAVLDRSERTVQRYVRHFSIRTKYLTTNVGQELRLSRDDVDRLATKLTDNDAGLRDASRHVAKEDDKPCDTSRHDTKEYDKPRDAWRQRTTRDGNGNSRHFEAGAGNPPIDAVEATTMALAPIALMSRSEVRGLLIECFKTALQEFDSERGESPSPQPRRFQDSRVGRVITWFLYGLVGIMSIGCLAYVWAIAKQFDLLGKLFG